MNVESRTYPLSGRVFQLFVSTITLIMASDVQDYSLISIYKGPGR